MDRKIVIKNFEQLLQNFLGSDVKLIEYSTKPLTNPGDNYGSLMLEVQIKYYDCIICKEKRLVLAAKMCSPSNYFRDVFDSDLVFKKEIAMYSVIIPTLRRFQKEHQGPNMDFFVKFYAARLSLNPSSSAVDDDAIILLENLKLCDYKVVDRRKGFDLPTTKMLIRNLAILHAMAVGLKLLQPYEFNKLKSYLCRSRNFDNMTEKGRWMLNNIVISATKLNKKCEELLPRIIKAMNNGWMNLTSVEAPREPFATIVHGDYWVNNVMVKSEEKIVSKMVDLQLIDYTSPTKDLLFFIFTSVQMQIILEYYDELISFYYNTFIDTLKDLKLDVSPFTFKLFEEEMSINARNSQFFHIMVLLKPVFAPKDNIKPITEFSEEMRFAPANVTDACKRRMVDVSLFFAEKNWI